MRLKTLLLIATVLISSMSPSGAHAFKAETHVWVGQQVINDLDDGDGKLSILMKGNTYDFTVDPEITEAILSNQDSYRMGNIGPDALPGIFTGQMVVHPGNVDYSGKVSDLSKWPVDNWLKWILNGADSGDEKAFAYGYQAHAASDVFSHTYINDYSGDIFLLTDGEIDVETRHIALEDYIVQHTPPLTDAQGDSLGESYENLVAPPSVFVRDHLILNDTVASQYLLGSPHLASIQKLYKALPELLPILTEVEIWVVKIIVEEYTGVPITDEIAEEIIRISQAMNEVLHKYNGYTELQQARNDMVNDLVDILDLQLDTVDEMYFAAETFLTVQKEANDLAIEVAQEIDKFNNTAEEIYVSTCETVCSWHCYSMPWPLSDFCQDTCDDICTWSWELNPAWSNQEQIVTTLLGVQEQTTQDLVNTHKELTILILEATKTGILIENDWFNAFVDYGNQMTVPLDGIRAHVLSWISDIENGMEAYVLANTEVMTRLMEKQPGALEPLEDWVSCWGYSVTAGVPSSITQGVCSIVDRLAEFNEKFDEFQNLVMELNPITAEYHKLKEKIDSEISITAEDAAYQIANEAIGLDVKTIVDLFADTITSDSLNNIFSVDNSQKGLLIINDMAARADADMNVLPSGYFDPTRFAAAYNSVLLAKLTLLTPEQLNELVALAGVRSKTEYGPELFTANGIDVFTVLNDSIKSIDGNNQWMGTAPPYPRENGDGDGDPKWVLDREYGYNLDPELTEGFRLWIDEDVRENVFRKIFLGPLNPGLHTPEVFGLGLISILPDDYPYMICTSNPYPDDVYDKRCENGGRGRPRSPGLSPPPAFIERFGADAIFGRAHQLINKKKKNKKFLSMPTIEEETGTD